MSNLHQKHIKITHDVQQIIQNLDVVFPSYYGKLYHDLADQQGIELKPDELLIPEMLDEKMVRHVITLAECTNDAIAAITQEDKFFLQTILEKTKQLQDEIEELQTIIYEDGLTKSFNRRWFEDKVLDESRIKIRQSGVIAMIDLNKFKEINDTYGHIVGDKVLILLANKLSEMGGRVVRYGGDEFIIIFDSSITPSVVDFKLKNLSQHFDKKFIRSGEHQFKINFAYGMAPFSIGADVSTIIAMADKAMYQNKHLSAIKNTRV